MDAPICGKTKAELKRAGNTEKGTQSYILERLQALENQGKSWFFRNNSFSGRITRYDGSQGYIKNNKSGAPDIICCFPIINAIHEPLTAERLVGQFVGIEIKGPTGKYEASQEPTHEAIRLAGGIVWTVYCPEDFEIYLRDRLIHSSFSESA